MLRTFKFKPEQELGDYTIEIELREREDGLVNISITDPKELVSRIAWNKEELRRLDWQ